MTNSVYVASYAYGYEYEIPVGLVTIFNGVTNSTTAVDVGTGLNAVAVNSMTNKIYVANFGCYPRLFCVDFGEVTVIDGATHSTTTFTDPNAEFPVGVAVNPETNKIYVANVAYGGNGTPGYVGNVTVIDGTNNFTTTVTDPNALGPVGVAVNPETNKIYVTNGQSNNVTVIEGVTNSTATVADPNAIGPGGVAVNPMTNKIYVTNGGSNNVTVIDGSLLLSTSSLSFGYHLVSTPSLPQIVSVTNTGNALLILSNVALSGPFTQTNNCNVPVQANSSCTFNITFIPTTAGPALGSMAFTDNNDTVLAVSLSGIGSTTRALVFPSLLDFGSVPVGTTSAPQLVTLANGGNTPLLLRRVLSIPRFSFGQTNNCGSSLTPGASCEIAVTLTSKFRGVKRGLLVLLDNARPRPVQHVRLRGSSD